MSLSVSSDRLRVPPDLAWFGPLLAIEALAVVTYFGLLPSRITDLRYVVYPFVWINAAVLAVALTTPVRAPRNHRLVAGLLAGAYFLALAWVTGLLGIYPLEHLLGQPHTHAIPQGWQVPSLSEPTGMSPPGWGPRIAYVHSLDTFHLYFVPYRVIGYLGLAYLLYTTVLDATTAAVSGAVGLVSCVSCAFPLVAELAAGVGGAALVGTVATLSTDISTAAFVVAVGLLYWRPGFDG